VVYIVVLEFANVLSEVMADDDAMPMMLQPMGPRTKRFYYSWNSTPAIPISL
jgi:hypothetical protein